MQHDDREDLLSRDVLLDLLDLLGNYPGDYCPDVSAYQNDREKVIPKVTDNVKFRSRYENYHDEYWASLDGKTRAKIHVFCPPLLQCILFALALHSPNPRLKPCEFQLVIHPDNRLLDGGLYSVEEGHESLVQLDNFVRSNADLEDLFDNSGRGIMRKTQWRFLAALFDEVWMDQRITASASNKRTGEKVDASEFFKESKEAHGVALMFVMAGPQICNDITKTAPLVGPDNPVQPSQVYRLEELADVDDASLFRWKTRYFCRIKSPQEVEERKSRDRNAVLSRISRRKRSRRRRSSSPGEDFAIYKF